ncbi:MAG: hypothetical protein IJK73_01075 [Bacteroidales bacterium]|nr:hypothetical protein [Bacteroidales bacterium]
MKKVIAIVAGMIMAATLFAQSSRQLVDVQAWKNVSMSGTCTIYATLVTDLTSNARSGYVTISVLGSQNYTDSNTIPSSEIAQAVTVLEYAKKNLLQSKPESNTQAVFHSSTDCLIGASYVGEAIKKAWSPFVQTDELDSRSIVFFKASDLEDIIKALNDCAAKISSFVAGS